MTPGFARASIANVLWWFAGVWLTFSLTAPTGVPLFFCGVGSAAMLLWLQREIRLNNIEASHRETDQNGESK